MKILVVIIMFIGAVICFGASKIAPLIFSGENADRDIVIVKTAGLVLVIIAALIAFLN